MAFYNRYVDLCREHGYMPNEKKIREILDLKSSTISSWKKGSVPQYETLRRLSGFFGVSIDYLLGNTNDRASQNPVSLNQPETDLNDGSAADVQKDTINADHAGFPSGNSSETSLPSDVHSPMDVNADERFLIELFRSIDPLGRARILHLAMSEKERLKED